MSGQHSLKGQAERAGRKYKQIKKCRKVKAKRTGRNRAGKQEGLPGLVCQDGTVGKELSI
jgi:hypothetical protein